MFLHWSWFLVATYTLAVRDHEYSSLAWNVAEYLALFCIVLMHEFGHALACRQTGGWSEQIVLWPLGGVAYVSPPPRAGAHLWSIAAGPLVNVVLVPVLLGSLWALGASGTAEANPDLADWLFTVNVINAALLCFNLLPIYPLDGGQILHSLLWFLIGPVNSLLAAAGIGLIGGVGLALYGLLGGSWWTVLMSAFIFMQCWRTFQAARAAKALMAARPVDDGVV